jgi:hypothetical protein
MLKTRGSAFPLLFYLVIDILADLVRRAQSEGLMTGLGTYLIEGVVAILQYADDTILLLEDNLEQVGNLKVILCLFEQM